MKKDIQKTMPTSVARFLPDKPKERLIQIWVTRDIADKVAKKRKALGFTWREVVEAGLKGFLNECDQNKIKTTLTRRSLK